MKKDWLNTRMKERFEDYDAGLDLEQSWKDLDMLRNPPRKKNKAVIYWMGLVLTGIVLMTAYELFSPKKNSKSDHQNSAAFDNVNVASEDKELNTQDLNLSNEQNPEITGQLAPISSVGTELDNPVIKENSVVSKDVKSINLKSSILKGHEFEMPTYSIEENTPMQEPLMATKLHLKDNISVGIIERAGEEKVIDIPYLTIKNPSIEFETRIPKIMEVRPLMSPLKLIQPLNKPRNSIGVAFAFGLHHRQLNAVAGDSLGFVYARKAQERALDAFALDLYYKRYITNDIFAEVGLGLQQTTYEFRDQEFSEMEYELEDQLIAIHNYPDGSQEEIRGDITVAGSRNRIHTFYQKFRQFHVSGILGKEFELGTSFGLGLSGGIEYVLLSKGRGVSFSETNDFRVYSDVSKLGYKDSGLLNGLMRIELMKGLNSWNEIGFSIIGKLSLNNQFARNEIVEKRHYLMARINYSHRF